MRLAFRCCLTAAPLGLLGLLGCGEGAQGPPPTPGFTVRDSAGIEIVENAPAGAESMLALTEELRIGVVGGAPEYELYLVSDIVTDREGSIYALLRRDAEVRVYSSEGRYLRTIGRRGDGPGEFDSPLWLTVYADTLSVLDSPLGRITVFTTSGELISTHPIRAGARSMSPLAHVDRGWLAELYPDPLPALPVGQIGFHPVRIALLPELPDRGGLPDDVPPWEIFDVVVEYPGEGFWGVSTSNSAQTSVWDPKPAHAFDAQGRIYVHHGAPYSIWVYDASGSLLRRVSRDTAPVPVTEAVRERYRASAHEYYGGRGGVPAFVQETLELTERRLGEILQFSDPDQVPKLGAMVVTDDGAIWVERPDLVEDPFLLFWNPDNLAQPRYWDVFDPDGRFLGTVRIERPTTIHAVGTDWILVTERDELDVQYIVRYGVGPGA